MVDPTCIFWILHAASLQIAGPEHPTGGQKDGVDVRVLFDAGAAWVKK